MTRKLNADRIRRHRARSIPDEIRRYFDTISSEWLDQRREYNEWLREFSKQMAIKHPNNNHIDVYIDRDAARMTEEVLVILRRTPRGKCGE
jgi:hypothetical protein